MTKTGDEFWMGTICENQLEKPKIYKWKIKKLNIKNNNLMVGVAPIDFDINSSKYDYGWYLNCYNCTLYSGKPHKYNGKKIDLKEIKNEITLIMNMEKGILEFIIDNEDKGYSITDIPLDKHLSPAVLLQQKNNSVEIIYCKQYD